MNKLNVEVKDLWGGGVHARTCFTMDLIYNEAFIMIRTTE